MIELNENKITVVGLGEKTGVSLIKYLSKGGSKIFVSELRKKDEVLESWNQVSGIDAEFEFGGHTVEKAKGSKLAVLCPGVPVSSTFVKELKQEGIEVISELEFAFRLLDKGYVISVTGTNGKSTTVALLGEILKQSGKNVFVGGNIGTPLVEALNSPDYDFYVIEVSTFQLEAVKEFKPDIGMLLNISPNHLDRHKSMNEYANLKFKMFGNQSEKDLAILNLDDDFINENKGRINSNKIFFSLEKETDISLDENFICGKIKGKEFKIDTKVFSLGGKHNLSNLMAATAAALIVDCPLDAIKEAMKIFNGLPHRIEFVKSLNGVDYFDDSKSTTVNSTISAMEALGEGIILIAGGKEKGTDFEELLGPVKKYAKAVILYGEAAENIKRVVCNSVSTHKSSNFDDAVFKAMDIAKSGDRVLLSPANASFDFFKNYRERGKRFQEIIMESSG